VVPDVVVGHSQGEIAAACVSGALSLEDALRISVTRSQLLVGLTGGGMLSVQASPDDIAPLLGEGSDVSLAAVNGPTSTVLSGSVPALDNVAAWCADRDIRAKRVPVDYASHSPEVEQIRDELGTLLAGIAPKAGHAAFHSTVTGERTDGTALGAEYWFRNLREPVRYADAVRDLAEQGYRCFIECSPHPVLTAGTEDSLPEEAVTKAGAVVAGSLRRDDGGMDRFLRSVGEVWVRGIDVRWDTAFTGLDARRVELPTYAFDHRKYWPKQDPTTAAGEEMTGDFWSAVENGDVSGLAELIGMADAPDALKPVVPRLSEWWQARRDSRITDQWRYRVDWKPIEWGPPPAGSAGPWLVVVPEDGDQEWINSVLDLLRTYGEVHTITVGVGDGRGDVAAAVVGAL
ncbi:acyltransferase domain-containing protein, partial [Streptomonospora sediminis]